jgi:predicted DsbA family dithiol-disulfide isomerase
VHFTAQIFFDFDNYDVWRIYALLLRASQDQQVAVTVEWRPFLIGKPRDESDPPNRVLALAAAEAVRIANPGEYDKFVRALLTMAYQEKDDPGSKKILAVAAHVAGIDGDAVIARMLDPGLDLLQRATDAARELGVSKVPTIVRQGPPVYVKTTGAISYGNPVARLELINSMLDDDGIWELSKP